MAEGAAETRRAGPRAFAAGLYVGALLPRLYVAIAWTREPVWDGHYYAIGARSIAEGRGYAGASGAPWSHYPPGYSALLGAAYKLFGAGQLVAPLLNALVGALLAVAVYLLSRHVASEPRARGAGILVAAYPGLVAYTPLVMTEPLAALSLVLAALAAVGRGRRGALYGGLILGLGALVRPQSLLCAPAIALCTGGDTRARAHAAAIACAASLLVVAPWTARNCLVMDGCALVSTNGGWNLAIGASPRATGRFTTLRAGDGCRIVTGQVQQDRCWARAGLAWIATDPRRWLSLVPAKLGQTFDHESFAVGYLAEADPRRWDEPGKQQARAALTWTHRALLALAPLAFVSRPARRRPRSLLGLGAVLLLLWIALASPSQPFWPLAILCLVLGAPALVAAGRGAGSGVLGYVLWTLASVVVVHAVFFGEDRYHLVVTPLLCLLVACSTRSPGERPAATGLSCAAL